MGEVEVVPPADLTPGAFVKYALSKYNNSASGGLVFKKTVGGRTIVLRIKSSGYGGHTASVTMRQGASRDPEPGGVIKDMAVEAGCELYAWLNCPESCNTMQKALLSPNGQALALCALFRLLDAQAKLRPDIREVKEPVLEIT